MELVHDPVIPLIGIYLYMKVHSSTIYDYEEAETWKPAKCPATKENKMW